ncbi:DUF421 domain-containing protein [Hymenobacter sediminicola]|uniref:DUF421 domain-containing protein n=1 Tax=Hymenobacter sediminicola TaxID=2761579 RepID=A0A7G7W3L7_9BACT|nr:YetF domain-containing protein [Hymenobacter sediminicola]QNH60960.1 DUF421 domain-containing protein [Hymenobacter sediminicola]
MSQTRYAMQEFFNNLLGMQATADTITIGQTCARAVLVFLVALVLLRLSGRRTFGGNSALDMVVKFMFGALLSRVIIADAPMGITFVAAAALVFVHRTLAYAVYFSPLLRKLVKGSDSILAEGATIHQHELRQASVSEQELRAGVRAAASTNDLSTIKEVRLEHDGVITVVKK